jgi:hypothetical protein
MQKVLGQIKKQHDYGAAKSLILQPFDKPATERLGSLFATTIIAKNVLLTAATG